MTVTWQLRTLIGQYEDRTKNKLTYRKLADETGLSKTLLNKIGRGTATRADLKTINTLLNFFRSHLGDEIGIDDILKYESAD